MKMKIVQEWLKSEKGECPFSQPFMPPQSQVGLDWAYKILLQTRQRTK